MEASSIIETGVDKLVKLVREKGRISVNDASKAINVSPTVINEWAEFLDEEGIIGIEYKLTTPYLVERQYTKKEIQSKAKEFDNKKELFVRKTETSIELLQKQSDYLKTLKDEFGRLSKKFNIEMEVVKDELSEIGKYEERRHKLREELRHQKEESENNLKELAGKLEEEKKDIQLIIKGIKAEEKEIEEEKTKVVSLEDAEKGVFKKIAEIKSTLSLLERRAKGEGAPSKVSLDRIKEYSSKLNKIKDDIRNQRNGIEKILQMGSEHKQNIKQMQETVLKKLKENEGKLKNARELGNRIKTIFEKKASATDIFETMDKNRGELQKELTELVKKAKAFQLSSESKGKEKQIVELERKFEAVDKKISVFEDMYNKLIKLTKGKKD